MTHQETCREGSEERPAEDERALMEGKEGGQDKGLGREGMREERMWGLGRARARSRGVCRRLFGTSGLKPNSTSNLTISDEAKGTEQARWSTVSPSKLREANQASLWRGGGRAVATGGGKVYVLSESGIKACSKSHKRRKRSQRRLSSGQGVETMSWRGELPVRRLMGPTGEP